MLGFYEIWHYLTPLSPNYFHILSKALINYLPLILLIYLIAIVVNVSSNCFFSAYSISFQRNSEMRHIESAKRSPLRLRPKVSAFLTILVLYSFIQTSNLHLDVLIKHSVSRISHSIAFPSSYLILNIYRALLRIS